MEGIPGVAGLARIGERIRLQQPGGFRVGDDLLPQPNWPDGHAERIPVLPLVWASGVVVAVRRAA